MKNLLIMQCIKRVGIFGIAALGLASCTANPSSPAQGGTDVAMRTQVDNSMLHSTFFDSRTLGTRVDSLQVTQTVFAVNNLMFRSDFSDDQNDPNLAESFLRQGQFIIAFDAAARQYIGESIIFSATYQRARFDLMPIHTSPDSLTTLFGPYAFLFASDGVSNKTMVVKGFVWKDGIQTPFTYSSSYTGGGSIFFDIPLVVPAGGAPMEVLVRFSSATAFTDKTGLLIDPRDGKNAAEIDANIKASLKASFNNTGS